ncbi:hypothetical protein QO002_002498 [Pararhizobium capsulatum DSM 1112]|uniref:Uncharacterized protein n=1 Tax=Pararhizobium capsulatum DSM 1112 TaxID=1121113 RepID=A0ABU0BS91_9HYPH|nr:hypothetical protein [Pararhizobium capsulatum DSM 1112]
MKGDGGGDLPEGEDQSGDKYVLNLSITRRATVNAFEASSSVYGLA